MLRKSRRASVLLDVDLSKFTKAALLAHSSSNFGIGIRDGSGELKNADDEKWYDE
jgi:hypothetical protein